jgi:hypothetical protein
VREKYQITDRYEINQRLAVSRNGSNVIYEIIMLSLPSQIPIKISLTKTAIANLKQKLQAVEERGCFQVQK